MAIQTDPKVQALLRAMPTTHWASADEPLKGKAVHEKSLCFEQVKTATSCHPSYQPHPWRGNHRMWPGHHAGGLAHPVLKRGSQYNVAQGGPHWPFETWFGWFGLKCWKFKACFPTIPRPFPVRIGRSGSFCVYPFGAGRVHVLFATHLQESIVHFQDLVQIESFDAQNEIHVHLRGRRKTLSWTTRISKSGQIHTDSRFASSRSHFQTYLDNHS